MDFFDSAFPVKIEQTGYGRGVVAKRHIKCGEVLFRDSSPLVLRSDKDVVEAAAEVARRVVTDHPSEEEVSSTLSKILELYPSTTGDLFKQKPMQYMKGDEATRFVRMIEFVTSEASKKTKDAVVRLAGCKDLDTSILYLLAIVRWNMIAVKDVQESRDIGWAISCGLSMFNHSCEPNVCHALDPSGEIVVRAITDIEAGEQLFMTYVKLYEYKKFRIQFLKSNYDFECHCGRCDPRVSVPTQSVLDQRPPCLVQDLSEKEASERENQLIHLAEQVMFQYVTSLTSGDKSFAPAIRAAKDFMKAAKGFYSALHPRFLTTIELLARIYCETEDYEKAATYFRRVLTMMDMVYPKYWFPKSLPLAVLSGLYRVLGDDEQAEAMAERRRDLLRVTRGTEAWDDGATEILPLLEQGSTQ